MAEISLHHKNLVDAVRGSILTEPDVGKRADIIHSVLLVIQQLLRFDNYGSAAALHQALCSPPVLRLRKTRAALKPAARTLWILFIDSVGHCAGSLTQSPTSTDPAPPASPLSESGLMAAFENAGTPKVPYLQPYLRQLKSIDAVEAGVKSGGDGSIDLDEKEQEEERDAMLKVIDEIEVDVSYHLQHIPVITCRYSACAELHVEFGPNPPADSTVTRTLVLPVKRQAYQASATFSS